VPIDLIQIFHLWQQQQQQQQQHQQNISMHSDFEPAEDFYIEGEINAYVSLVHIALEYHD
jgi:preprotein translocase subunit YajC